MPRYQFAIDGQEPAPEVEWFPDDVTALKVAAQTTAELGRHHGEDYPIVIAIRLSMSRPSGPEIMLPCGVAALAARRNMAESHVNEGRRIVGRQRLLVASLLPFSKLRRDAEALLSAFERSQEIFEADLEEIKAQDGK